MRHASWYGVEWDGRVGLNVAPPATVRYCARRRHALGDMPMILRNTRLRWL